jgi:type II secretory pathway pseudopilin PulG
MLEVLVAMMVVFLTFMTSLNGLLYATLFQVKAEKQAQATYWIQQDMERVKSEAASLGTIPNACTGTFRGGTSYGASLLANLASNNNITNTTASPGVDNTATLAVTDPITNVTVTYDGKKQTQVVNTSSASTTFTTNTTQQLLGKEYRLVRITEGYNNSPQILKITYKVGVPNDSTTERIESDTSTLATLYTEVMPAEALNCS